MTSRIPIRTSLQLSNRFISSRIPIYQLTRRYATETPQREPQSRAGTFYRSFGSPILTCFLGALFTYQVAYWGWMKLESLEERRDKTDEIQDLKAELKELLIKKAEEERMLKEHEEDVRKEKMEPKGKKGWW